MPTPAIKIKGIFDDIGGGETQQSSNPYAGLFDDVGTGDATSSFKPPSVGESRFRKIERIQADNAEQQKEFSKDQGFWNTAKNTVLGLPKAAKNISDASGFLNPVLNFKDIITHPIDTAEKTKEFVKQAALGFSNGVTFGATDYLQRKAYVDAATKGPGGMTEEDAKAIADRVLKPSDPTLAGIRGGADFAGMVVPLVGIESALTKGMAYAAPKFVAQYGRVATLMRDIGAWNAYGQANESFKYPEERDRVGRALTDTATAVAFNGLGLAWRAVRKTPFENPFQVNTIYKPDPTNESQIIQSTRQNFIDQVKYKNPEIASKLESVDTSAIHTLDDLQKAYRNVIPEGSDATVDSALKNWIETGKQKVDFALSNAGKGVRQTSTGPALVHNGEVVTEEALKANRGNATTALTIDMGKSGVQSKLEPGTERVAEKPLTLITNDPDSLVNFIKGSGDIEYRKIGTLGKDAKGNPIMARHEYDPVTGKHIIYATDDTTASNLAHELGHYFDAKLTRETSGKLSNLIEGYEKKQQPLEDVLSGFAVKEMGGTGTSEQISSKIGSLVNDLTREIDTLSSLRRGKRVSSSGERFADAVSEILTKQEARDSAPTLTNLLKYADDLGEGKLFSDKPIPQNLRFYSDVNLGSVKRLAKEGRSGRLDAIYKEESGVFNKKYYENAGLENAPQLNVKITNLKKLNEAGHEAGDEAISGTAKLLQEIFPDAKVIHRGGKNFSVITDKISHDDLQIMAEKLQGQAPKEWGLSSVWGKDLKSSESKFARDEAGRTIAGKSETKIPGAKEYQKKNVANSYLPSKSSRALKRIEKMTEGKAKSELNGFKDIEGAAEVMADKGMTAKEKLEELTLRYKDDQTGAWNLKAYVERKASETTQVMADIDKMSNLAKKHGDEAGDEIVNAFTDALEAEFPGKVYRKGSGEEIAAQLDNLTEAEYKQSMAAVRADFKERVSKIKGKDGEMINPDEVDFTSAIGRNFDEADSRVVAAKNNNRRGLDLGPTDDIVKGNGKESIPISKGRENIPDSGKPGNVSNPSKMGEGTAPKSSGGGRTGQGGNGNGGGRIVEKPAELPRTETGKKPKTEAVKSENITTNEDVQKFIDETIVPKIKGTERIGKTNKDIVERAFSSDMTEESFDRILTERFGNLSEDIVKGKQIMTDSAVALQEKLAGRAVGDLSGAELKEVMDSYNRLVGTFEVFAGVRTELSNAFRSLGIGVAPGENDILRSAVEEIQRVIGNETNPFKMAQKASQATEKGPVAKYFELWYPSMLSGPKTTVRNLTGNLSNLTAQTVSGLFTKEGRQEFMPRFFSIINGHKEALNTARKVFKGENNILSKFYEPAIPAEPTFKGKFAFLNKVEVIGKFLNAQDAYFSSLARGSELAGLRTGGVKYGLENEGLVNKINDGVASYFAQQTTFRNQFEKTFMGEVGKMVTQSKTSDVAAMRIFGNFIFPFVKTVANIVDRRIDFIPILNTMRTFGGRSLYEQRASRIMKEAGLFDEMYKTYIDKGMTFPQARAAAQNEVARVQEIVIDRLRNQQMGRFYMGLGVTAAGVPLVASNRISGTGPTDKNERAVLMKTGWRPNSINIPGVGWLPYQNTMLPISGVLSALGNLNDAMRYGPKDQNVTEIIGQSVKNFFRSESDQSFLKGMADIYDLLYGYKTFKEFSTSWAANALPIPAAWTQTKDIIMPDRYEANTFLEQVQNRVGITAGLQPRLDAFGDQTKADLIFGLTPPLLNRKTDDPVLNFMQDTGVFIGKPQKATKIDQRGGKKRVLTPEEYTIYVQESGKAIYDELNQKVSSGYFGRFNGDKDKIKKEIQSIVTEERNRVKRQFK